MSLAPDFYELMIREIKTIFDPIPAWWFKPPQPRNACTLKSYFGVDHGTSYTPPVITFHVVDAVGFLEMPLDWQAEHIRLQLEKHLNSKIMPCTAQPQELYSPDAAQILNDLQSLVYHNDWTIEFTPLSVSRDKHVRVTACKPIGKTVSVRYHLLRDLRVLVGQMQAIDAEYQSIYPDKTDERRRMRFSDGCVYELLGVRKDACRGTLYAITDKDYKSVCWFDLDQLHANKPQWV